MNLQIKKPLSTVKNCAILACMEQLMRRNEARHIDPKFTLNCSIPYQIYIYFFSYMCVVI